MRAVEKYLHNVGAQLRICKRQSDSYPETLDYILEENGLQEKYCLLDDIDFLRKKLSHQLKDKFMLNNVHTTVTLKKKMSLKMKIK